MIILSMVACLATWDSLRPKNKPKFMIMMMLLQKDDMTVLDSCAVHYHIKVVWRLLGLVPPPPAFLLQMTEVATLGTQAAALQALR